MLININLVLKLNIVLVHV